jgi:oxalate decarboxylase/phosphoglucose isomerase-like protein (cupin superfamily)
MDRTGRTWTEPMAPGSVHHVPLATAHRVINTSDRALVFISYWASETGHDYQTIVDHGFRSRVFRRDGAPTIVAVDA